MALPKLTHFGASFGGGRQGINIGITNTGESDKDRNLKRARLRAAIEKDERAAAMSKVELMQECLKSDMPPEVLAKLYPGEVEAYRPLYAWTEKQEQEFEAKLDKLSPHFRAAYLAKKAGFKGTQAVDLAEKEYPLAQMAKGNPTKLALMTYVMSKSLGKPGALKWLKKIGLGDSTAEGVQTLAMTVGPRAEAAINGAAGKLMPGFDAFGLAVAAGMDLRGIMLEAAKAQGKGQKPVDFSKTQDNIAAITAMGGGEEGQGPAVYDNVTRERLKRKELARAGVTTTQPTAAAPPAGPSWGTEMIRGAQAIPWGLGKLKGWLGDKMGFGGQAQPALPAPTRAQGQSKGPIPPEVAREYLRKYRAPKIAAQAARRDGWIVEER